MDAALVDIYRCFAMKHKSHNVQLPGSAASVRLSVLRSSCWLLEAFSRFHLQCDVATENLRTFKLFAGPGGVISFTVHLDGWRSSEQRSMTSRESAQSQWVRVVFFCFFLLNLFSELTQWTIAAELDVLENKNL